MTPEAILRSHREVTQRRVSTESVVLFVQDTTELDYSDHPPRDAKYLASCHRRGLSLHAQLAVTPEKLCLGVVRIDFHEREFASLGKLKERKSWPIEEKERRNPGDTKIISVCRVSRANDGGAGGDKSISRGTESQVFVVALPGNA